MTAVAAGVEAAGIVKRFGGFKALDGVSLRVRPGTVHALLGENGAGKSTLVKCLLGYYRADTGSFAVDGRPADIVRPADADALGIGMVYQHFTLVPSMTVAENLVMARRSVPAVIDWRKEHAALDAFMASTPFRVPADVPVGGLAAGERQKTEILKQLYLRRRCLVLDEPTSVLTPGEAEEMLGVMRGLAHANVLSVVLITHKLREVTGFADDVTVLRRGRPAGTGSAKALGHGELTAMMIGEAVAPGRAARSGAPEARPRLVLRGLRAGGDRGRPGLAVDRLAVHDREIVGVAGVAGNGQGVLVETLGGQRHATAGTMLLDGEPFGATREEVLAGGVRVLPEEPLRGACVPSMTVADNLALRRFDRDERGRRHLRLDRGALARHARRLIDAYAIRTPSPAAPIKALSGGNVQRVVLARELDGTVRLLVVANPCFGLDVKAAAEVRARIMTLRNAGCAVLLVSEDLDEIMELSDRIVVMREGRVVHETPAAGADPRALGGHMAGHG